MDDDVKKVYEIIRKRLKKAGLIDEYERDWVDGFQHTLRIDENRKILFKTCPCIPLQMNKMLKVAIAFCNCRKLEFRGCTSHAEAGAAFFLQEKKKIRKIMGFSDEEVETIAFAIRHHRIGLQKLGIWKAECDKHILLGLLTLVVSMDSICFIGYYRVLERYARKGKKFTLVRKDTSFEELRKILEEKISDHEVKKKNLKGRQEVLSTIVHKYNKYKEIYVPVEYLLSEEFLDKFSRRREKLKAKIEGLIRLEEKNRVYINNFGN